MKKLPTDDPLFGKGSVRSDGRKLHNMYLFEVKKPDEFEISLGLLQADPDHSAERGLAAAGRGRLRFPQVMTAADDGGRPVALVTGGGGDIGRAIALRLARNEQGRRDRRYR